MSNITTTEKYEQLLDTISSDILKDPYIFEFLKIAEPYHIAETQLESLLCDKQRRF